MLLRKDHGDNSFRVKTELIAVYKVFRIAEITKLHKLPTAAVIKEQIYM